MGPAPSLIPYCLTTRRPTPHVTGREAVRIVSRHGAVSRPVHVTRRVRPGQEFATFQTPTLHVNMLTSSHGDARAGTRESKGTVEERS
jgi:predicted molibdopterin-dependent oxidoreductase YjgC